MEDIIEAQAYPSLPTVDELPLPPVRPTSRAGRDDRARGGGGARPDELRDPRRRDNAKNSHQSPQRNGGDSKNINAPSPQRNGHPSGSNSNYYYSEGQQQHRRDEEIRTSPHKRKNDNTPPESPTKRKLTDLQDQQQQSTSESVPRPPVNKKPAPSLFIKSKPMSMKVILTCSFLKFFEKLFVTTTFHFFLLLLSFFYSCLSFSSPYPSEWSTSKRKRSKLNPSS